MMRRKVFFFLLCSLLLTLAGCGKRGATQSITNTSQESGQAKFDVCRLIEKEEIEAIQGSPIKETNTSARSEGGLRISQCFYTAAEFSRSVNVAVIQRDPDQQAKRSPRDFWKETFDRKEGRTTEEKEASAPPKKIDGIGEEAYWSPNRFGGVFYVLKGDAFVSISVGGADNEETKINKSTTLARKALQRF
jgi:hypothetical protein